MNQKERMLAGLPYKAWLDGLTEERTRNKLKVQKFNQLRPDEQVEQEELIRSILGKAGKSVHIEPPFYCDYGLNIEAGDHFYANFNCTILDVGRVKIGNNVMFAPNVSLYSGPPDSPGFTELRL